MDLESLILCHGDAHPLLLWCISTEVECWGPRREKQGSHWHSFTTVGVRQALTVCMSLYSPPVQYLVGSEAA